MKTKGLKILALTSILFFASCVQKSKQADTQTETVVEEVDPAPIYDTSEPKTILKAVAHAHGGWGDLWNKRDVQYTYDYRQADGKADISTERYIFSNEASLGKYTQHDINVMPGEEGEVIQCFDGKETVVMINGNKTEDAQLLGLGDFLRKANYFWFTMPYKLTNEGTIVTYQGQEEYNGTTYDKVHVTYDPEVTGKEQNDIYILYVNPTTKMIDRFYFSLPFLGVNEPVIIANYEYTNVDGQTVATRRTYFLPSEEGYSEEPNLVQTLTDVNFNNGFTVDNMMEGL
ncbi:DUF6503 family protein [Flagellimonas allohymeniacidonis]|uniref:Lipoprotein n=1 Tax=Flagellimonas allohymeniacidonis TaxID=2517819 RepID=A0A4Q8QGA9_9FLAO|nr:DUF6503 family protein [Allomuricauda hymeniacidonis]TAI49511.1 hypothetical protein EW142_06835 [Allomuricauda hymeniacidonis]